MNSGKLMGMWAMYDFRIDPDLGTGKTAIRRMPYACDGCLNQLNSVGGREKQTKNKEDTQQIIDAK